MRHGVVLNAGEFQIGTAVLQNRAHQVHHCLIKITESSVNFMEVVQLAQEQMITVNLIGMEDLVCHGRD